MADVRPGRPTFLTGPTDPHWRQAEHNLPDVVIRAQALGGTWETIGVDRAAGVWPENVELSADGWGSKTASFDLRRDPKQVWPDLGAFTPIRVEVGGQLVWSGRVSETPSRDGADQVMTVACEGWQHHLDDDLYERMFVHSRLSDWKDRRTVGLPMLTSFGYIAAGVVRTDGSIVLSFPNATAVSDSARVGVILDCGETNRARRCTIRYETSNNNDGSPQVQFAVSTMPFAAATDGTADYGPWALTTMGPSGTATFNLTTNRFVVIRLGMSGAGTITNDAFVKLDEVVVYGETTYESGQASVLKASDVVLDSLKSAAPLLSADTSLVTVPSFAIPEYAPNGPRTPREHIEAVNAYHGYVTKVDVGGSMVFREQSGAPKFEVGDWSALELADSSQNSGQDIYNRVIVTGQDPAGNPVRSVVSTGAFTDRFRPTADYAFPNPSFDADMSGWTWAGAARTTTAGEFVTPPGGAKVTVASSSSTATTTLAGTAKTNRTYVLLFDVKTSAVDPAAHIIVTVAGGSAYSFTAPAMYVGNGTWRSVRVEWTPMGDVVNPGFNLNLRNFTTTLTWYVDSFRVVKPAATIPDRRGFARAKQLAVNSTLPSDGVAAAAIGNVWLTQHSTTPFRGTATLTGPTALRGRQSGQPIPLARLLTETGELIHFSDRKDPDTGTVGRDGRIAAVTYRPATDEATVTLDNQRSDAETWLSRLAVVTGSG